MEIEFWKYQGTGNDFILIDNRSGTFPHDRETLVAALCNRHFGIGADGLILLETDPELPFSMCYFNADGRVSSMCGNGGRCIAAFAWKLGIAGTSARFRAVDGIHESEITPQGNNGPVVSLKMNDVADYQPFDNGYRMDTGSPHLVLFRNAIDKIDVRAEGAALRHSAPFKGAGINVNFAEVGPDAFRMRTYERGVEDETLSCGTGTVAVALALIVDGHAKEKEPIPIQTPGGTLEVTAQKTGTGFTGIRLKGPAQEVFQGQFNLKDYDLG